MQEINKRNKKTGINREYVFIFMLAAVSIFLLFYGLGTRYLWQDEAQTPLIAKTIIERGLPYGTDGVNNFSQEGRIEFGSDYLWKWHPWLPFYAEALSIKLLGNSNFSYRFPFALFGFAAIFLVYFMVRRLTGSWQKAAFAAFSVVFSTAFLLLARQCRYYGMEMFFCVGALLFYLEYLRQKKSGSLLVLFVLMAGIFHTLYVYFFVLLAVFGLHQLVFKTQRDKWLIITLACAFLVNVPFLFLIYGIDFSRANGNMFDIARVGHMVKVYVSYTMRYLFPYMLTVPVMIFLVFKLVKDKKIKPPSDMTILFAIFSLLTLIIIPILTPTPFLRNLAGIVIPFAVLSGLLCYRIFEYNKISGVLLVIILVFCSPFLKFINEITADWEEAGECIVKYINMNSKPTDTVLITYPDMPLKLYTKLKIYGGLSGDDVSAITKPDFVVIRKVVGSEYEKRILEHVNKKINVKEYTMYQLPCADRLWENREDIAFHDFGPDEKESRVIIYKRNEEKTIGKK